jgi:hypothetical protein
LSNPFGDGGCIPSSVGIRHFQEWQELSTVIKELFLFSANGTPICTKKANASLLQSFSKFNEVRRRVFPFSD